MLIICFKKQLVIFLPAQRSTRSWWAALQTAPGLKGILFKFSGTVAPLLHRCPAHRLLSSLLCSFLLVSHVKCLALKKWPKVPRRQDSHLYTLLKCSRLSSTQRRFSILDMNHLLRASIAGCIERLPRLHLLQLCIKLGVHMHIVATEAMAFIKYSNVLARQKRWKTIFKRI